MEGNEEKKKKKKRSPWSKFIDLIFRVGHVAVGGILFGGLYWQVAFTNLRLWHWLTVGTGVLLIGCGMVGSRHWIYQGRGILALFHLSLVWLAHSSRAPITAPLLAVLVSGVVGSHLPG
ncbi:hypothetical protein, partial [Geomonas sp.]|uniref:hypothetical protein n=1 Tax=Geomonas sp. TaxID=2651584 RepID=UPI002B471F01